jgi:hypothetical protein
MVLCSHNKIIKSLHTSRVFLFVYCKYKHVIAFQLQVSISPNITGLYIANLYQVEKFVRRNDSKIVWSRYSIGLSTIPNVTVIYKAISKIKQHTCWRIGELVIRPRVTFVLTLHKITHSESANSNVVPEMVSRVGEINWQFNVQFPTHYVCICCLRKYFTTTTITTTTTTTIYLPPLYTTTTITNTTYHYDYYYYYYCCSCCCYVPQPSLTSPKPLTRYGTRDYCTK